MNDQRGLGLIEVMITLLLVCVGVLGMVALQSKTVQYTQDSVQRNAAALLASNLMEIIRSNPDAILDSRAQLKTASDFYKQPNEDFATCSSTDVYSDEPGKQLACWAKQASDTLPGAKDLLKSKFYVCRSWTAGSCDSTKGSAIEIQLAWSVKKGECLNPDKQNETTCTYTIRTEL
ncbi:type IV pilus modification protein PilV [Pseudomonas mangiferae]|uniref:Type IV pilus modification protein PilV n=1 Tax=Pseudomonas mangiferae TaxID=2593654 RepID=A0A553H317_9PSED|nr:type IV pilus modification protein PilV [Pseudomonas mangiferae]TRX76136.1 type IV pilus modification protein PilV [Pseudomonas mangiferae]